MVIFDSEYKYLESQSTLEARITACRNIIEALLLTAAKAATKDHIEEYWLNDGQTQIKTIYKGVDQIYKSIEAFKKLEQYYLNQRNGRVTRLVDSRNFIGNGNYR